MPWPGVLAALLILSSPDASTQPVAAQVDAQSFHENEALIRELGAMEAADQEVRRRYLSARRTADDAQRTRLAAIWNPEIARVDRSNVARLKTLLRDRGWVRISEVGPRASSAALMIVQHSGDLEFMKQVLAQIEPLAPLKEVSGEQYALLYDRIAVKERRLQRYGTQSTTCADGHAAIPRDLEEPENLDRRRTALGMEPMADFLREQDRTYGACKEFRP
jgi:hypothetical protein